jgi:hypothetical protein
MKNGSLAVVYPEGGKGDFLSRSKKTQFYRCNNSAEVFLGVSIESGLLEVGQNRSI